MQSISTEIDSILREEIELAKKDDAALIVRSAFDVIEDFLAQGMSLERIASALQKHDFKITKGHLVRHIGIVREERGLEPLKRGKRKARPMSASVSPTSKQQLRLTPGLGNTTQLLNSSTCATEVSTKPTMMAEPQTQQEVIKTEVKKISKSKKEYPEEVAKHKYFTYKGQNYNILEMNIDDYQKETRKYQDEKDVPPEIKKLIFDEGMLRGLFQSGLKKYADAISDWDRKQKVLS